ncbi:flavodoxin domain-containing protein [Paenarthrobacter nitroguajacolicus]
MIAPLSFAIIGSGPSGCYLAQSLRRSFPESEIVIYDRLASPFGLVRYGVAPDHQSTKSIQAQFARLFERENVDFAGNIELGKDVSLEELRSIHHIVVLATGLAADRVLSVPGENLPEVYRAGRLTRLFNAHPLEASEIPKFGKSVAIIGGGNVSIDILRLLIKQPEDFLNSDIDDAVLGAYFQAPVSHIDFICRSNIVNAPSDPVMLAELGRIRGVQFICNSPIDLSEDAPRAALARARAIKELIAIDPGADIRATVTLHFGWAPVSINGEGRVQNVELRSVLDDRPNLRLDADSIITAIGFDFDGGDWHGLGELDANLQTGVLDYGLYRTGWFKRGSRGTIAENRLCAKAVAEEIFGSLASFQPLMRPGYGGLSEEVRAKAVDYSAWKRLDSAERNAAAADRSRRKFPNHEHMVAIAHNKPTQISFNPVPNNASTKQEKTMKIQILFGTESGNAEIAAEDLADSIKNDGQKVEVNDLSAFSISQLQPDTMYVLLCSTYGEGELPNTALQFYADLSDVRPDLSGVRYAMFGLGDTFYTETYGQGANKLDHKLAELGAQRVGEIGRYDASSWEPVGEAAVAWFAGVLDEVAASH